MSYEGLLEGTGTVEVSNSVPYPSAAEVWISHMPSSKYIPVV